MRSPLPSRILRSAVLSVIALFYSVATESLAQQMPETTIGCSNSAGYGEPMLSAIVDPPAISQLFHPSVDDRIRNFRGLIVLSDLATDAYPVLPLVCFDAGSAEIPVRYLRFSSAEQTVGFDDARLPGFTPLDKYLHILNIIGYRLKTYPDTKISIAGYDSKQKALGENSRIAEERVLVVHRYLTDIWQIDPARITIAPSGGYPRRASSRRDTSAIAENRRVEIITDDWEILKPIIQQQFRLSLDPSSVTFRMANGIAEDRIDHREIEIMRNGRLWTVIEQPGIRDSISPAYDWKKGEGIDSVANDWKMGGRIDPVLETESPFVAQLVLHLKDGGTCRSPRIEIPVMILETAEMYSRYHRRLFTSITKTYPVVLFDYGSADLDPLDSRILRELVSNGRHPQAEIMITGHASRERGSEKLSDDRAASVLRFIRRYAKPGSYRTLEGRGAARLFYDPHLPEARFFSRMVEIQITRPVAGQ